MRGPAAFADVQIKAPQLHSRFFFITGNLKRGVRPLHDHEFKLLAKALTSVRRKVPFALCGYCFMPDHWHAILLPEDGTSISDILMRIKIATYQRISKARECPQPIWQSRFYDHILHWRSEFDQTLAYVHENPAVKGWLETQSIGSGPARVSMRIERVRLKRTMSVCH